MVLAGQRRIYEAMMKLDFSSLRFSEAFMDEAAGEVFIVRPARAHPSKDSPTCMHSFAISPEELSNILDEGKITPLQPLVVTPSEMAIIRAMYRLATEMTQTEPEDKRRKLYAKMQHLMRSAPALRVTNGFIFRADPEAAIMRPAQAFPCLHPFPISPDKLSIILGESDDDDDSDSSPDEMEILRRAILQQRNRSTTC